MRLFSKLFLMLRCYYFPGCPVLQSYSRLEFLTIFCLEFVHWCTAELLNIGAHKASDGARRVCKKGEKRVVMKE